MRIPVWFVAAAIIVMSLLTGILVGVAVDRRMLLHRGPFFFTRFSDHHRVFPNRFENDLGLSPAQTAAVDSIMQHRMAQRDSLMAHTWPVMRQLLDSTRYDIEKILTPAQREKFEHLRDREPGGPPGVMMRGHFGGDGPVIIQRGDGPPGPPPPTP